MVKAIEAIGARMIGDLPDHASARNMQAEVNRLRLKAEALDTVHRSRNPMDTPSAHALKVAKLARTLNTEATATINRAGQILAEGLRDVQRRMDEKVNMKPDAFAEEIRRRFFEMKPEKKADTIKKLVDQNRGPELAAIVHAPEFLTGISAQERDSYGQMMLGRHAAEEVAEAEKLSDVFDAVYAATRAAETMVKEMTDPTHLARIESEAAAADAAIAAFNQAE